MIHTPAGYSCMYKRPPVTSTSAETAPDHRPGARLDQMVGVVHLVVPVPGVGVSLGGHRGFS